MLDARLLNPEKARADVWRPIFYENLGGAGVEPCISV